jgi:hypothetical protein
MSVQDLFNIMLVSKYLKSVAEDTYIYKNVSLNKVSLVPWRTTNKEGKKRFLYKICHSLNPEYHFRMAYQEIFCSVPDILTATKYLTVATSQGHHAAIYTLALLMVLKKDESAFDEGTHLLTELWDKKCLLKCRQTIHDIETRGWMTTPRPWPIGFRFNLICKSNGTCNGVSLRPSIWVALSEDDFCNHNFCLDCRLDLEVRWFKGKCGFL